MSTIEHKCPVCHKKAISRCARCKNIWYCGSEHQRSDWKRHKKDCNDSHKADQLTLHKQEFDRIVKTYKLDTDEKSDEIADFLTTADTSDGEGGQKVVSPVEFSERFGMKVEEAVVFLEWIKVGIKFKEESIDAAKKSGIGEQR